MKIITDTVAIGALAVALVAGPLAFAEPATAPPPPATSTAAATTTTVPATLPLHRPIMEAGQPPVPTTVPLGFDPVCGEPLMRLALDVGWPAEQLRMLDRVARRESGGDCGNTDTNYSHNASDPQFGSCGLGSVGTLQVNSYWFANVKYNPHPFGWLGERGVVDDCNDLFNTTVNLQAGLLIWQRGGWSAWGF